MKNQTNLNLAIALGLILFAVISRLVPHLANFTAIISVSLFSGFVFKSNAKLGALVPLIAMIVSDMILPYGFNLSVYGSIFMISLFSNYLVKENSVSNVLSSSVSASLLFFLVTNFFSWLGNPLYIQDLSGLIAAYVAGIPFFGNMILSTLVFSSIFFSFYSVLSKKIISSY